MAEDNHRNTSLMKRRYTVIRHLIFHIIQHIQLSYLPPLMVYLAAGISGLTGIVGTFFIKDYLDLPAEFLAMLGLWAGLPWALKMPQGHVVDLIWRCKSLLVLIGTSFISACLDFEQKSSFCKRLSKNKNAIQQSTSECQLQ